MFWVVRDPFSGQTIQTLTGDDDATIARKLSAATASFAKTSKIPAWERAEVLEKAATRLQSRRVEFADLIRREAGKPIVYAEIEVERAIGVLRWAAAEAVRRSGELLRLDATSNGRAGFGIHTRFPRGPVLGITPFNFPLNLTMHKIAPAIACGAPILIKPSPFAPLTALKILELFEGTEPGWVQVTLADDESTRKLTQASEIATLSFTGSARVGRLIREQSPHKPTTLELGGNAWVIVAEDLDPSLFPAVARRIARAAFGYAGQSCISVQNVAIADGIHDAFFAALEEETRQTAYGDPALRDVVSGPMIHAQATSRVLSLLKQIPRERCTLSTQSYSAPASGFVSPTLIQAAGVSANLIESLVHQEVFAPLMNAHRYAGRHELERLIQKIHSSPYGLQAGIFTQHLPTIERLYQELKVGGLVVNDVPTTRYDHQPYGGVKESGQGREGIAYAIDELTDSKFLALSSIIPL